MTRTLKSTEKRLGCLMTLGSLTVLLAGAWLGQGHHGLGEPFGTVLMVILLAAGGLGLFLSITWPAKHIDRIRAAYSLDQLPRPLLEHADAIARLTLPCVSLAVQLPGSEAPEDTADTKLGGLPYLAGPQDWPATSQGTPMVFVGQLNFARLAAGLRAAGHTPPPELPRHGLLQLFTLWRDWDPESTTPPDDVWRTRWIPAPGLPFIPQGPPDDTEVLTSLAIYPGLDRTLPETGDLANPLALLGDDPAALEAYADLLWVLSDRADESQVLGHGCWDADPRESLESPASWRLLWQIHGAYALDVGDFGPLYMLIRDSDLRAGRFDNVIVRTEF